MAQWVAHLALDRVPQVHFAIPPPPLDSNRQINLTKRRSHTVPTL